jgi:protease-4
MQNMDPSLSRCRRPLALLLAALVLQSTGCFVISGNVNPFASAGKPLEEHTVSGSGRDRIVMVDITGEITSESTGSAFGLTVKESTVSRTEAALRKALDDDRVVALIVRINSPGGTVTASDILYEQIRRFKKESSVPVIAEVVDMAASGAYYAALAADEIVAHPTSVVGSVGVIMQSVSLSGLMQKIGVRNQSVKTGEMKDIGSPLTEMTEAQRQVLEGVVGDMYQRFLQLVRENRPKLTDEADKQMQDGRIFSARQALSGGLIDRIEYLDQTIERTKRMVGVDEATVVVYRQPSEFVRGIYSQAGNGSLQMNLLNVEATALSPAPRLLYLWVP